MGKIDIPFWKFVFDLIQTMFTVGIAIYVWIVAKHKANASRINALEDKTTADIHEVTQRLTVIETKVEQMPDRTAIGNIHRRLDEQAKTLHKLEGTLEGVNDTSRLIREALLKGEKS